MYMRYDGDGSSIFVRTINVTTRSGIQIAHYSIWARTVDVGVSACMKHRGGLETTSTPLLHVVFCTASIHYPPLSFKLSMRFCCGAAS